MNILVVVFFTMVFYSAAAAEPVAGCHCFQNRQFDSAKPGAVDPYVLTTTQHSFLASVFGIDKKQIVQAKMREGVSGDDLWIARITASKTGADAKDLLASRKASGSWEKALELDRLEPNQLGLHFKEALVRNISDEKLSSMVVDQVIVDYFGAENHELKS